MLWALALLGPSICVLWLVRKTVESEKIVARQFASKTVDLKLENAEIAFRESLNTRVRTAFETATADGGFDCLQVLRSNEADAAMSWNSGYGLKPSGDSAKARPLLAEARTQLDAADSDALPEVALALLSRDDILAQRFDGGRCVSAMVAELCLKRLETLDAALRERIDEIVVGRGKNALPAGQRDHLLDVYGDRSNDAGVELLLRNRRIVRAWQEESGQDGRNPPLEPIVVTPSWVGLVDTKDAFALVFRRDGFARRWSDALGGDVFLAEYAVPEPTAMETGATAARLRLAAPFDWLVLRPSESLEREASMSDKDRTAAYFWIGGIVLGLSLVSGFAIVLFVRSQTSAAQLKNDLVATVTHELKTPVTSIRLLVDTLRDERRSAFVNREEYLELIDRENRRLGHLIDNFLSFSRLERNKNSFTLAPLDAGEVLAEAESAFRDRFKDRVYDLRVEVAEDVPQIYGDREALWTAVGNLLENALKYGGPEGRIVLSLNRGDGGATFAVQDFGKGISPRERKRIFKRFYQVDRHHAAHAGSVGLGLSIVEFIVSSHHGSIDLESELGVGSVFKITIPYA